MRKSSNKKIKEAIRRLSKIEKKYNRIVSETNIIVGLLGQVEDDLTAENQRAGWLCPQAAADYGDVQGVLEPLVDLNVMMNTFDIRTWIDTLHQTLEKGVTPFAATPLPDNTDSGITATAFALETRNIAATLAADTSLARGQAETGPRNDDEPL